MKVYVVSGHTDIHNCGYEGGNPRVFTSLEKAKALVEKEYAFWRKEYENDLSPESIASGEVCDLPPNENGAFFSTDRDDRFNWDITEVEVDEDGEVIQ